jgi:hypothetical protein
MAKRLLKQKVNKIKFNLSLIYLNLIFFVKLKIFFIILIEPSDIPEDCKTLFIRNLPYDMKED